ncbi:putative baseplate assembly protein [Paracoccus aminovorans]|uniref:Putative baseplate assembly protein n=2 Tax=Paracoccus aminovorans TaxID=34004 RepID=A0A1I3ATR5_9RHOB|nr:putative baseplate assembly protein [Paracoccus aminovorans]CQR86512.1 putative phage tail region protein [Paracoccus aminovorans]SFH53394.1 putative baseplate assembly protein [Paracoccus aminovorans]
MARSESFLDERRERLAASPARVNGIAGIEVDPADMTRLTLRFVHPLPGQPNGRPAGPALKPFDLLIEGGDRIRGIGVVDAVASGRDLALRVNRAGDFSAYTLRIRDGLAGWDPILREIRFAFRLHCDSGDCASPAAPPPDPAPAPQIDYLARDYDSYRRMMLDRMAVGVPDWTERNPADTGVALVEWLAYLGDGLSYLLDHAGTEYALETARLRVSAARHARLVGYRMHNGASARALAQVRLAPGVDRLDLPRAGLAFLTRPDAGDQAVIQLAQAQAAVESGAVAFEPLAPAVLHAAHDRIALHHWGDPQAMLAAGTTFCDLRDPDRALKLAVGDLLVLMQARDPVTGRVDDADPAQRQAVRLAGPPEMIEDPLEPVPPPGGGAAVPLRVWRIRWDAADALRFDLHIGAAAGGPMALALGNMVPADHGFTLTDPATDQPLAEPLGVAPDVTDPEAPPAPGAPDEPKARLSDLDRPRPFRPRLSRRDLSFAMPPEIGATGPAAALMQVDPARAVAQISLRSTREADPWRPEPDLLGQPADALRFVPEVEADGTTRLRFASPGIGNGKVPLPGDAFTASYRIGQGRAGNIGAGALARIAVSGAAAGHVVGVWNPLPAQGGTARETVAETRQRAPVSFHQQRRAVTLADYEALLNAHPQVQRATARKRWLGGWAAIFLTVDRVAGLPVDDGFRQMLLDYLEPYRMMGHDLAVDAPILVPLQIAIRACAAPDAFADKVAQALAARFSAGLTEDGRRGFFHPDNVSFGSRIYLSHIYRAALEVPGVADLRVTAFGRAGQPDASAEGVLDFGPREIPVLSNDPNRPGEGRLTIETGGGR